MVTRRALLLWGPPAPSVVRGTHRIDPLVPQNGPTGCHTERQCCGVTPLPDVIAQDGLPARDSGRWGLTKLSFLDDYCPAALQATKRKLQRCYVDLFAGPGINV